MMGLGFLAAFGASVLAALAFALLIAWGARLWMEVDEGGWSDSPTAGFAVGAVIVDLVVGTLLLGAPL